MVKKTTESAAREKYVKKYGEGVNGRINFSKISGSLELPNLVEVQTDSFKWFLDKGLDEVFREMFPIQSYSGKAEIRYISSRFEEPVYTPLECKANDQTYSRKLKVRLALKTPSDAIREGNEVYMGEIPMMTDSGTFIVNGAERVIVSQILRSPGAYFQETVEKSGIHYFEGELMPNRGTWLQFESDQHNVLHVRIDHTRKMPATILFRALGIEADEEIKKLFGDTPAINETLRKDPATRENRPEGTKDIAMSAYALSEIFRRLKPGEPITPEGNIKFIIEKFFDPKRYDLGRAGRFKYNVKLSVYDRLPGRVLAEDLFDANGEVATNENGEPLSKDHKLTKEEVEFLKKELFFEKGAHRVYFNVAKRDPETGEALESHNFVTLVNVYAHDKIGEPIVPIAGNDPIVDAEGMDVEDPASCVTVSDMVACFSYFCNLMNGIGNVDDIDHLGNRRVRSIGELLQECFRIGLTKMTKQVQQKMSISDLENEQPKNLINTRQLSAALREFFASGQLSQFMDQTNPLAELANKRRISALGRGGLTRDRASMEVRDVHFTHYGRICPVETPEGQNVGLINNLSCYAKIDRHGFLQTPYRTVIRQKGEDGLMHSYVSDEAEYLTADEERGHYIAEANINLSTPRDITFSNGRVVRVKEILDEEIVCRHNGENEIAKRELIDYADVSPKQIVSIAAACIPFLENDDCTRALMGANMQRQALPLLRPEIPYVGTGIEAKIAKDSGLAVLAVNDGTVTYVDSARIVIKEKEGDREYSLQKFERSNGGTCINQKPVVHKGDKVKAGDVLADGPAMCNGELALGRNMLIAYMTWNGYNYEDAIVMSERLVKDDCYTTIHIQSYDCECRETKLGDEEITRDIPNVGEDAKNYLDEDGIIIPGAEVKEGDILVGKVTPKGLSEPNPEEKLLAAIFSEKAKDGKDTSLRVPHGGAGIVLKVKISTRRNKDPLAQHVQKKVRVYVVQKRKISEGDKMSGRHGNKGVISKILPVQDMPFLPDGTPIDIMLSPMGVPSRMNIGQIFEVHLGLACRKLGMRIATPVFDGIANDEIFDLMKAAGMSEDGKTVLYDGRTGDRFPERINVGIMYMIKLVHMVDDKLHARATGPYSLVTQQPLGGKAQNGGQRFGEMEVWALEAYGAAHILQEMLTIKSDDRVGRRKTYEAIIKGLKIPHSGMPEAFKVMTKELRGLGMSVKLFDQEGETIDMDVLTKEALIEERKVNSAIRNLTTPKPEEEEESAVEESISTVEEQAAEEGLTVGTRVFTDLAD